MYTRIIYDRQQHCAFTTSLQSFRSGGRKETGGYSYQQHIDKILITQLSDEDAVVLETKVENITLIIVSMCFDINRPIDNDLQKMEAKLTHLKWIGIIFAIDRNSRSTAWNDVLTNKRGKIMEEILLCKQLHIANEDRRCTTF
jgi:hypothetical protein